MEYLWIIYILILFFFLILCRVNHTPVYEELSEEEMEKRRAARRVDQANNPHYLKVSQMNKTENCKQKTEITVRLYQRSLCLETWSAARS